MVSAGIALGYNVAKGIAYGFKDEYSPTNIALKTGAAFFLGFTFSYAILSYTALLLSAGIPSGVATWAVGFMTIPGMTILAVNEYINAKEEGDEIDQYFATLDLALLAFGARKFTGFFPRKVVLGDPKSLANLSHFEIAEALKAKGFSEKPYTGTSTAFDYIQDTPAGRWTVTVNYGGGIHSGGNIHSKPYYYKVTGPNVTKTKVIDPSKYPKSEWGTQTKWKIIDGTTGKTLKEAGVRLTS